MDGLPSHIQSTKRAVVSLSYGMLTQTRHELLAVRQDGMPRSPFPPGGCLSMHRGAKAIQVAPRFMSAKSRKRVSCRARYKFHVGSSAENGISNRPREINFTAPYLSLLGRGNYPLSINELLSTDYLKPK